MTNKKEVAVTTTSDESKTVTVREHTRSAPAMRGFDRVTIKETATRTTIYEKAPKK